MERYLAEFTDTEIIRIQGLGAAGYGTSKQSICDTKANVETFLRDIKGFTQAEIDEKMPMEEEGE